MDKTTFYVINSFATIPFGGNPAAVFPNADGLSHDTMQLIARQLNLVETVFVLSSETKKADFELRFFTPSEELPVAGHPSIAAWYTLSKTNRVDYKKQSTFFQKTKVGIQEINISILNNSISVTMKQPLPKLLGTIDDVDLVAKILGVRGDDIFTDLPIQPVDTGLGHLIVPMQSLKSLMQITRKIEPLKELCEHCGIREIQAFCFQTYDSNLDLHTRNICPREGIEDPACGIGNGALGCYLMAHYFNNQKYARFSVEQGNIIDMPSVINVSVRKNKNGNFQSYVGGGGIEMIKGNFII